MNLLLYSFVHYNHKCAFISSIFYYTLSPILEDSNISRMLLMMPSLLLSLYDKHVWWIFQFEYSDFVSISKPGGETFSPSSWFEGIADLFTFKSASCRLATIVGTANEKSAALLAKKGAHKAFVIASGIESDSEDKVRNNTSDTNETPASSAAEVLDNDWTFQSKFAEIEQLTTTAEPLSTRSGESIKVWVHTDTSRFPRILNWLLKSFVDHCTCSRANNQLAALCHTSRNELDSMFPSLCPWPPWIYLPGPICVPANKGPPQTNPDA